MARVLTLVAVLFFAIAGCGSTVSRDTADCEDFVEQTLCPTLVYCGLETSRGSCDNYYENVYFDCPVVVEYPAALDACAYDVTTLSCSQLASYYYVSYGLPYSCNGAFAR